MKYGWAVLLMLAAVSMPATARAQASAYGTFTYTDFSNKGVENLFGGTIGLKYDVAPIGHHVVLAADVQGRFVRNNYVTLEGFNVGPRFSVPFKNGFTPYAAFLIGFDRFSYSPTYYATTDNSLQVNGGVGKQISPRFDVVAEYSYGRFFGLSDQNVPQTISVGTIYYFAKRDMPDPRSRRGKDGALPTATHPLPPKSATPVQ